MEACKWLSGLFLLLWFLSFIPAFPRGENVNYSGYGGYFMGFLTCVAFWIYLFVPGIR